MCLMKYVTNIPCPSCGSTRAILSILRGKYSQGFYQNPLGYILILIIFITPLWLIYDFIKKEVHFYHFIIELKRFSDENMYIYL